MRWRRPERSSWVGRRSRWLRPVLLVVVGALLLLGVGRIGAPVRLTGTEGTRAAPAASPQGTGTDTAATVTSTLLACPGPELQGLSAASVAEQAQPVVIAARSAPLEALDPDLATQVEQEATQDPGELRVSPTGATPSASQRSRQGGIKVELSGPEGAVVQALGAVAPGVAATQVQQSLREQSRGLELTSCLPPAEESWLFGGGGAAGRLERLVLVNPGADPVTATIRVLGGDGPAEPEETDIVVPGGGRVVELVDALATERSAPVVRVTTDQGSVAAFLGDRWLQGSTELGMELTTPSAPPATEHLVPALVRTPGAGHSCAWRCRGRSRRSSRSGR